MQKKKKNAQHYRHDYAKVIDCWQPKAIGKIN